MRHSHVLIRYRPVRQSDGRGGFTENLELPLQVVGTLKLHENRITLLIDPLEDVVIGDVLAVEDEQAPPPETLLSFAGSLLTFAGELLGWPASARPAATYRVTGNTVIPRARVRELALERLERPIVP